MFLTMLLNDVLGILVFVGQAVLHVGPAFLISVGLGVLIRFLKLDQMIRSAFNRQIGWAILLATLVGAFSPFCSCSVIPIIASLLLSGVPLAPVMSFWIASPTMDPEIFALSVATLGLPLAIARLVATLILSLSAGYLTLVLTESGVISGAFLRETSPKPKRKNTPDRAPVASPAIAPLIQFAAASGSYVLSGADAAAVSCCAVPVSLAAAQASASCGCSAPSGPVVSSRGCSVDSAPAAPSCGCSVTSARDVPACGCSVPAASDTGLQGVIESFRAIDWREFAKAYVEQAWNMAGWLLLAFFLEALIGRYVAQETIAQWVGGRSIFAVPMASLIGIPLYLSNVTALPIVSGLLAQGMQSGAAIAFLIAGPITTVPAMAAVWGIVRRRVFYLYLGIGLFGSMLVGYLVNIVLP